MRKVTNLFVIFLCILALVTLSVSGIYTDTIDCDDHTIIVSVCTGKMRALETGISVYAGYNKVPLILSDKTLPKQLDSWLPEYVERNNITKIIVVGPVTAEQLLNFMKLGVKVKQINGNTIPEILTKIAENVDNINKDEVIITASDPLAGELGAYMKIPVFITATNSTYDSADTLDGRYMDYLRRNNIQKVTIVGNMPDNIKEEIKTLNITIEEITGENSLDVSSNLNEKLKKEGHTSNSTTAFYGFYGEIPTIIPTLIRENGILIEDSSNKGDIIPYLKENNISTVYILRNKETDYIQMEETDYISSDVIKNLENNNITIRYLTKSRTLDEATGLYDMKIATAEYMENHQLKYGEDNTTASIKTQPPLIAILNETAIIDSNNISATITQSNSTDYIVKWDTIHPYFWKKIDNDNYHITTKTGYEYIWKKENNTWTVQYKYNNTDYYQVKWKENADNSWTETHDNGDYTWKYNGRQWNCYNDEMELIYFIEKNN